MAERQGFEPWEGLHPQRFSRTAYQYSTVVMGVKYSRKYGILASWFVMLCQYFQRKPRHGLVTARLSVESQSRWELEGNAATQACAMAL